MPRPCPRRHQEVLVAEEVVLFPLSLLRPLRMLRLLPLRLRQRLPPLLLLLLATVQL